MDFVAYWSTRTELSSSQLVRWIGISRSKFYEWRDRYGKVNEHNALVPRDWWLEEWEKEAIIRYFADNPLDGYRRLTFMMMDEDIVAVSPSSVYRVLKQAGLTQPRSPAKSMKGTGFVQPLAAHDHWHIDVSYVNICGTFYYLCGILDGFSRYIVHWELRESMKEMDVEIIVQRAKEKFPEARPRIISDNGPQFVAREFKEFVRLSGMSHVRTSPYYPQSNGKYERWNGTIKRECIRPNCPSSPREARDQVGAFVDHYNNRRLHSAIGYVAPADKLANRAKAIHAERDRKLTEAREARKARRQQAKLIA